MRSFLFILAVIFVIVWALGTFYYYWGMLTHVLLMLAAISAMRGLIICPKPISAARR